MIKLPTVSYSHSDSQNPISCFNGSIIFLKNCFVSNFQNLVKSPRNEGPCFRISLYRKILKRGP